MSLMAFMCFRSSEMMIEIVKIIEKFTKIEQCGLTLKHILVLCPNVCFTAGIPSIIVKNHIHVDISYWIKCDNQENYVDEYQEPQFSHSVFGRKWVKRVNKMGEKSK